MGGSKFEFQCEKKIKKNYLLKKSLKTPGFLFLEMENQTTLEQKKQKKESQKTPNILLHILKNIKYDWIAIRATRGLSAVNFRAVD